MKKTIVFSLMAATLLFSACSSDSDTIANDTPQKKGMKLNAVVPENLRSRATIGNTTEDTWTFAFTENDQAKVTNSNMSTYYTFTKSAEEFSSAEAEPTSTPASWYAYFPSTEVSLTNQTGNVADVANKFALAGATSSATTGEEGLTINMEAKVAILVIDNQKGAIDINIKNSADTWVTGLTAKANEAAFDVTTSTTKTSILNKSANGKYYVAVPAGVQLAIKNGDEVIKSTVAEGLEAGKYYTVELAATYCPDENHLHMIDLGLSVKWACMNVGATSPEGYGKYYAWGETTGCEYPTLTTTMDGYPSSWTNETNPNYIKGETKSNFDIETYKWAVKKEQGKYTYIKYCTNPEEGIMDNKTTLEPEDDAARVNCGGNWRIPTSEEASELVNKCYWVWTDTYNGNTDAVGFIIYKAKSESDQGKKVFIGETASSNYSLSDPHIFLPATGFGYDYIVHNAKNEATYQTSSLNWIANSGNYVLYFRNNYAFCTCGYRGECTLRAYPRPIRAVCP